MTYNKDFLEELERELRHDIYDICQDSTDED